MIRRLPVIAFAISLLLWAAAMILWASAETWKFRLYHRGTDHTYGIESGGGVLTLVRREPESFDERWRIDEWSERGNESILVDQRTGGKTPGVLGFRYATDRFIGGDNEEAGEFITIPMWFLALPPAAALALLAAARYRHARRIGRGLCLTCGYDLRANKDRCPECGTPIPETTGYAARPTRNKTQPQKTQETQKG